MKKLSTKIYEEHAVNVTRSIVTYCTLGLTFVSVFSFKLIVVNNDSIGNDGLACFSDSWIM